MLSKEISYFQAKANLANLLEQVGDEEQIVIVKRPHGKNVALIAEKELSSLLESVYLLRSPENAQRLFRSLEWAKNQLGTPQTIAQLKEELEIESNNL
ncbi:MAG: type II toxin-antitoxin system prevent-host-death family antitoxin [Oscillatoria sp. PMC 1068.18]|nr:type II toxin-antitoxin system prevent-host-death family antitoxin [Oscillatoria sp. PMC 1076.18]MEC4987211.1 type II toxin-antitoxin system prevent-host-death family antitoxin [Oscillatoria sp. PMC 1068.18]